MPVLNAAQTADTYPDNATGGAGAAIISQVYNSRGGWFSVSGASVFLEMQYGPQGSNYWTEEVEVGTGAFAYLDKECTGVRFRSAAAGVPATVTAQIAQGDEPPLSIVALGVVGTSGRAPTQTILHVGAGTYTTPSGCVAIRVEAVGAGGGGGGAVVGTSGQVAVGGGGGGGAYASLIIPSPAASYPYVVGAGGAGGGNPGSTGQDTSFGSGPLVLAKAGTGGVGMAGSGAAPQASAGGVGGAASACIGTVVVDGGGGGNGFAVAGNQAIPLPPGGAGAVYGSGVGGGAFLAFSGNLGNEWGGGGSGSGRSSSTGSHTGGAGQSGIIVVTEFY